MNRLVILSPLLLAAAVCAASSGRAYENEQVLDSQNNFILRWTVDRAASSIEMEYQVNCTGWTGIKLSAGVLMFNATADIIVGGYNDATKLPYIEVQARKALYNHGKNIIRIFLLKDRYVDLNEPVDGGELDVRQDVVLFDASYYAPWTVVRFTRQLNTGDRQDLPILVRNNIVKFL